MDKKNKPPMIYLTQSEYAAIQLAIASQLDLLDSSKEHPWNPETRKDMKDIKEASISVARKIEKVTGLKAILPPYIDGEEKDYFTKPS